MKPATAIVGLLALLAVASGATGASAQSRQFGFLIGGMSAGDIEPTSVTSGAIGRDSAFTYQFFYGRSLADFKLVSLHFELPVVVATATSLENALPQMPKDYSGVFVTPGLMLRFLPGSPFVPYVSLGVGFAWFESSDVLAGGGTNTGSTGAFRGAAGIGGGVDFKLAPLIGLRLDIRDFRSGKPNFNIDTSGGQHNLLVSGGVVLRF